VGRGGAASAGADEAGGGEDGDGGAGEGYAGGDASAVTPFVPSPDDPSHARRAKASIVKK
jgi:hypothetical protein